MTDASRQRSAPGRPGPPAAKGQAREGDEAPRASIGEYLARQRKLRGISIEELCARTKIPRRNIERLESGALDDQPDGFARGFVRTLAEALGLDADEAVMRLMREPEVDDERAAQRERRLRLYRGGAIALALLFAGLLGSLAVGWLTRADAPDPTPENAPGVIYRSDVVRALARETKRETEARGAPEPDAPPPSP